MKTLKTSFPHRLAIYAAFLVCVTLAAYLNGLFVVI